MGIQIPSKDITYFEQCFNYIGGDDSLELITAVNFITTFLVNPAYAISLMGGDGGEDELSLGYNGDIGHLTLFIYDKPEGWLDTDTIAGNLELNDEVVESFKYGYHKSKINRNYHYITMNDVESVNDDTKVSWNGMLNSEGEPVYEEYWNGIIFGDWGFFEGEENNGDGDGGAPVDLDNSNLPPFYGLFYAMVIAQRFSPDDENQVDMTKPYAVIGKMVNKLKRL